MKTKVFLMSLAALAVIGLPSLQAQGLHGVGQNMTTVDDFDTDLPLTYSFGVGGGYDNNTNTSSVNANESGYASGNIGAIYQLGSKTSQLNLGGFFGATNYFDQAPGIKDNFYNARITLDGYHRVNPRLTLTDNAYFTYEFEPDFVVGASTARRSDQYFYFYNRLAASYAWSRRFSTVTAWSISGIDYQNGLVADTENRLTNLGSLQGRYALNRRTSLTSEYRFQYTDYSNLSRNIKAHYFLVGADHFFSRTNRASLLVGAQYWDDSNYGASTKPYGEFLWSYKPAEDTEFIWSNRVGFESNEVSGFKSRYSFRSGITARQRITPYLRAVGGLSYVFSDFSGGDVTVSQDEQSIAVSTGLLFRMFSNTDLVAMYYFTDYNTDQSVRDYTRHRVSLGVSSTF